jgi:hypothetical protein
LAQEHTGDYAIASSYFGKISRGIRRLEEQKGKEALIPMRIFISGRMECPICPEKGRE